MSKKKKSKKTRRQHEAYDSPAPQLMNTVSSTEMTGAVPANPRGDESRTPSNASPSSCVGAKEYPGW